MYKICLECKKRSEECKCEEPILETVFEHGPQGIPPLDEEQWKFVVKEMNKPPTPEQIAHLKHCREVFDNIERNSRRGKIIKYYDEIIDTEDGHKWFYDNKYECWIDVEPSKKMIKLIKEGKFVKIR